MPFLSERQALINMIVSEALEDLSTLDPADDEYGRILDEADDDIDIVLQYRYACPRRTRLKSKDWCTRVLPNYSEHQFRKELRITREQFGFIYAAISDNPCFHTNRQLPMEFQLAITLQRMGDSGAGSSWQETAEKFGVSKGIIGKAVERVLHALIQLQGKWIKWPTAEERKEIELHMSATLPYCVGFLGSTCVHLQEAPIDDPESYLSGKKRYGIQVQAVVDSNRRFLDVCVGYPASVDESKVFKSSAFGRNLPQFLTEGEWVAASSAYPLSKFVITPFHKHADVGLTTMERATFQEYFSEHRAKVDHAFGILKKVFPSLNKLSVRVCKQKGHKKACHWIFGCIILYNMIQPDIPLQDIELEGNAEDDGQCADSPAEDVVEGEVKRRQLLQWILGQAVQDA